jgi:glutamate N-acetyltransferase/amino-acid N-acetyltransferase
MAKKQHITLPDGFTAAGVHCGIKSSAKQEDLAIIACEVNASTAILTTSNQLVGAPIEWCRELLPKGHGRIRGVVINSGCANVFTGEQGMEDVEDMAERTGKVLGVASDKVLVASTGLIGQRLPIKKVRTGITKAGKALSTTNDEAAARAILTTDTKTKSAVAKTKIGAKEITVAGIAKGSGMIAPSLATMIAVITTDANITGSALRTAVRNASKTSFNAVSVDSDTSTSDIVVAMASGKSRGKLISSRGAGYKEFSDALQEVCDKLAYAVVADGEGATKVIHVHVKGAASKGDAEAAARSIADSPLVKTAMHGADPNWGRIVVALGKSPAKLDPEQLAVSIGETAVFRGGMGVKLSAAKKQKLVKHLKGKDVEITADLGGGKGNFTVMTCDLSRNYIKINADYST